MRILYKAPECPATEVSVPDELKISDLRELVEGHVKLLVIASDSVNRICLVVNDSPQEMPFNISLGDQAIHGPIALIHYGPGTKPISLRDDEVQRWSLFLDEAAKTEETEPEPTGAPPPIASSGISIIIVPIIEEHTPEEMVDQTMKDVEVNYEHVPPKGSEALYAAALETLRLQGHEFEIRDQSDFVLRIKGRDGVVDKHLRLIEVKAPEISCHEELAAAYSVEAIENEWEHKLMSAVEKEHDLWLVLRDGGVEIGTFADRELGYPLEYPFAADDWIGLVAEISASAPSVGA